MSTTQTFVQRILYTGYTPPISANVGHYPGKNLQSFTQYSNSSKHYLKEYLLPRDVEGIYMHNYNKQLTVACTGSAHYHYVNQNPAILSAGSNN